MVVEGGEFKSVKGTPLFVVPLHFEDQKDKTKRFKYLFDASIAMQHKKPW